MNILKRILSYIFEDEVDLFYSFRKASLLSKIKILSLFFLIFLTGIVIGISLLLNYIPIINWIINIIFILYLMNIAEKIVERLFNRICCILDVDIE